MTIDTLLFLLRISHSILVSDSELWLSSHVAQDMAKEMNRALRRHRRGVRLLLAWGTIDTCPNPGLHRPYYYHAGSQQYRCSLCERLKVVC